METPGQVTLHISIFLLACSNGFAYTGDTPDTSGPWNDNLRRSDSAKGPFFILEPPSLLEFSQANQSRLDCMAAGSPHPSIRWLDEAGREITTVPGLRVVLPNSSLALLPFAPEAYRPDVHATTLRCAASSPHGVVISHQVRVKAVVVQEWSAQVFDAYVLRGNTAVLHCNVGASLRDYIAVTSWMKNGVVVAATGHMWSRNRPPKVMMVGTELHIEDVQSSDADGKYRCVIRHRLTGQEIHSSPGRLVLTDASGNVPPRLTQRPSLSITTPEGQDVMLTCAAQAFPVPRFQWFRMEGMVPLVSDGISVMVGQTWVWIRQAKRSDSGKYRCLVTNSLGEQSVEIHLTVASSLRIEIHPQQQTVNVGQSGLFNCTVAGGAFTELKWLRNGLTLQPGPNVRVSGPGLGSGSVLQVLSVSRHDAGIYQCFAKNSLQVEVQATAELLLGDEPPRLVRTFAEQTLQPGSSLTMLCIATGSPSPTVTWSLDDSLLPPISPDGRVAIWSWSGPQGEIRSRLNISALTPEHSGLYGCQARNAAGLAGFHTRVNVYGPVFVRWVGNKTAVEGQSVSFHCPYGGFPVSSIEWTKNGDQVKYLARHTVWTNGTVLLSDVRGEDAGPYTCTVKGPQGTVASRSFHVHVAKPPVIEAFQFSPNVQENGRTQVTCSITSGDLPMVIEWLKDNRPLPPGLPIESQTADFYSILVFKKLQAEHSGLYTCTARNSAATASHSSQLQVKVPPKWVVEPRDVSAVEGQTVTLPCQAKGLPEVRVTWTKSEAPGQNIEEIPRFTISSEGDLAIRTVSFADDGYYVCSASNNVGANLSKTIRLQIHQPVRIQAVPERVLVKAGSEVRLTCEVTGDPIIDVKFIHSNGAPIPSRLNVTEWNRKKVVTLILTHVDARGSGTYVCEASNPYGSDRVEFRVMVQEALKRVEKVNWIERGSRWVKITWDPPPNAPEAVPLNYLVQTKLLGPQQQLASPPVPEGYWDLARNVTVPGDNHIVLQPLLPASVYQARVWAFNELSWSSEPSATLNFQTLDETPSAAPVKVMAEARSSREVRLTWQAPPIESWHGKLIRFIVTYSDRSTHMTRHRSVPWTKTLIEMKVFDVTLTQLAPATQYAMTVRAANAAGTGPESETVVITTPEAVPGGAPETIACTAQSARELRLTWQPPVAHLRHGYITGYKILYRRLNAASDQSQFVLLRTTNLELQVSNLQAGSNYSFRIGATNRMGDGVLSFPVLCATSNDVPYAPSDLKAVTTSTNSIRLVWLPPEQTNGPIIHYNVFLRDMESGKQEDYAVYSGRELFYEFSGLKESHRYEFWVTATSSLGAGRNSRIITQSTTPRVPARILALSQKIYAPVNRNLRLACPTAGGATVSTTWKLGGKVLNLGGKLTTGPSGLSISDFNKADVGDYSCHVQNVHGQDVVTYTVLAAATPAAVPLTIKSSSTSTITLGWPSNTGATEFLIKYRVLDEIWEELNLDGSQDQVILSSLRCGQSYEVWFQASNVWGAGIATQIFVNTRGSGPLPPSRDLLVLDGEDVRINADFWPDNGCPITSIKVEKKGPLSHSNVLWDLVEANVNPNDQPMLKVSIESQQRYQFRVTAFSEAGVYTVHYEISTVDGVTKSYLIDSLETQNSNANLWTFRDTLVVICVAVAAVLVTCSTASIAFILYKRRWTDESGSKEQSMSTLSEHVERSRQCRQPLATPSCHYSPLSLRKHSSTIDYDDEEVMPYATFTLQPVPSNVGTWNSATSEPEMLEMHKSSDYYGKNSMSPNPGVNSLEDVYCPGREATTLQLRRQQRWARDQLRSPLPPYEDNRRETKSTYDTKPPPLMPRLHNRPVSVHVLQPPANFSDGVAESDRSFEVIRPQRRHRDRY